MRIIAGDLGGRRLRTLDRPGLRPTTDRVRESVFSMIASRIDLDGADVLDMFAGSGALGIEALSRGAGACTFVESDRRTAQLIEENLRTLGVEDRARVVVRDALRFVSGCSESFDVILADPPYAAAIFDQLVHDVFARELLRNGGLFVLEHASTMRPRVPDGADITASRAFGDTCVTIYTPRLQP